MFFQFLIDAVLTSIMLIEVQLKNLSEESQKVCQALFQAEDKSKPVSALKGLLSFAAGELFLAAIAAPIMATGTEVGSSDQGALPAG